MVDLTSFNTAQDLFKALPTAGRDMKAIPTDQPPDEFCRSLLGGKVPEESITFCAYMLPKRVAVRWGHDCLTCLTDLLDERDRRMLALVRNWIDEPEEDRRHAAMDEAMGTDQKTPGIWIALAAAWSSGSLGLGGTLAVAPAPSLTARAVNAGILAGLARVALADRMSVLTAFAEMGIDFAATERARRYGKGLDGGK